MATPNLSQAANRNGFIMVILTSVYMFFMARLADIFVATGLQSTVARIQQFTRQHPVAAGLVSFPFIPVVVILAVIFSVCCFIVFCVVSSLVVVILIILSPFVCPLAFLSLAIYGLCCGYRVLRRDVLDPIGVPLPSIRNGVIPFISDIGYITWLGTTHVLDRTVPDVLRSNSIWSFPSPTGSRPPDSKTGDGPHESNSGNSQQSYNKEGTDVSQMSQIQLSFLSTAISLMIWATEAFNLIRDQPGRIASTASMWIPVFLFNVTAGFMTLPYSLTIAAYHRLARAADDIVVIPLREFLIPRVLNPILAFKRLALRHLAIIRLRIKLIGLYCFDTLDGMLYRLICGKQMLKRRERTMRNVNLLAIEWRVNHDDLLPESVLPNEFDWPLECLRSKRNAIREILSKNPIIFAITTVVLSPFCVPLIPFLKLIGLIARVVLGIRRTRIIDIVTFVRRVITITSDALSDLKMFVLTLIFAGQQLFLFPFFFLGTCAYNLVQWMWIWIRFCHSLTGEHMIFGKGNQTKSGEGSDANEQQRPPYDGRDVRGNSIYIPERDEYFSNSEYNIYEEMFRKWEMEDIKGLNYCCT